jgi:hypothetical protein
MDCLSVFMTWRSLEWKTQTRGGSHSDFYDPDLEVNFHLHHGLRKQVAKYRFKGRIIRPHLTKERVSKNVWMYF